MKLQQFSACSNSQMEDMKKDQFNHVDINQNGKSRHNAYFLLPDSLVDASSTSSNGKIGLNSEMVENNKSNCAMSRSKLHLSHRYIFHQMWFHLNSGALPIIAFLLLLNGTKLDVNAKQLTTHDTPNGN